MNESLDLIAALQYLLGEKAASIFITLAVISAVWSQLRQFVPVKLMAKLPNWLIWVLEFVAANKWSSENSLYNDPRHHKVIYKARSNEIKWK